MCGCDKIVEGYNGDSDKKKGNKGLAAFLLIWVLLGLCAFVMSVTCFLKGGTVEQNIIGLLLAILFGPFYFIYYFSMKSKMYCQ